MTRGLRPAAGGDEQPLAGELGSVLEAHHVVRSFARHTRGALAEVDSQRLTREGVGERFAQGAWLTWKDVLHSFDQVDVRAERRERLCHLNPHWAAAEDHDAGGNLARAGGLAVGPHPVELPEARDRRDHGLRSCGDDDVLRAVAAAVDVHQPGIDDPAVAAEQVDSGVREPHHLSGVVVVRDHVVAPRERGGLVRSAPDGLGSAGRGERGIDRFTGPQQRLGGNAGVVGALAGDELALDDRNVESSCGERTGAVFASRAAAKHDHVVVVVHLSLLLVFACTRVRSQPAVERGPWPYARHDPRCPGFALHASRSPDASFRYAWAHRPSRSASHRDCHARSVV